MRKCKWFLVATALLSSCSGPAQPVSPAYPESPAFADHSYCELVIANPRKKGHRSFHSPDKHHITRSKRWVDYVEWYNYSTRVLTVVRLDDGTLAVPMPYIVDQSDAPQGPVMPYETWDSFKRYRHDVNNMDTRVFIPIDDKISKYIFLLYCLKEDTNWRVFEVDRSEIRPGVEIQAPDLLTLPLAADADDSALFAKVIDSIDYSTPEPQPLE
jgi:hypothetical protein